jgi:hypothetical protein
LAIAVGSGSLGALGTYLAANVWTQGGNRWLALGSILQGLGTLGTLLLLVGHLVIGGERRTDERVERWLDDLTAADPLARLIAVRSLSDLDPSSPRRERILEFFRHLLPRESDPDVRSALLANFRRAEQAVPLNPLPLSPRTRSIVERI